jgi:hypothetical protein
MRISEHRYRRDRRRYDLAIRFMQLEARTRTICEWTGLTADRVRKLHRALREPSSPAPPVRRRGKSPYLSEAFTRTSRSRHETTVLGSLLTLFDVVPASMPRERHAPAEEVWRGERLCQAYEAYLTLIADSSLTFEHAALLASALTHGEELRLGHCADCAGLIVTDRLSLGIPRCSPCFEQAEEPKPARSL